MTFAASDPRGIALSMSDAAFGYAGETRVRSLTLEVPEGAAVALIGPNGSGKSTLLRGVLGLAELTAGSIRVLGTSPDRARRGVGSLPQADTRDASLPVTLRQVVTMGLYRSRGALRPIGRAGRAAVDGSLDRVGLREFAGRRFGELSGGQQQRGILARALVANPRLLLLDEPFNGLDRENREALLHLVRELRDEGRTVLVSTHDLEIAQQACTHVLLLASGHRPGEPGHPAAFGPLDEALTLDAVQHAFQDTTVELDQHTVTTTRETEV
ncbi:metal ABC transporter ATP-binding protein [Leucobacter triazinivorans]|uniref:ABC transporter ATP-binding protein n=1 Tax=Leucobacter triazinivorans TaxID=1784719 RepID=A0A4P6KHJ7_9MICO|nr:ABC transporter ATP-binding protein [Leucobacter triazinivorans]QBE49024.1 ABC transporter ATP-binding protein [Leucobacter triazinivorans]